MHTDARKIDQNSTIEGDLCIIGAGAAGISMALDWAASEQRIILLEGGGFDYESEVQDLYAGMNTGQRYFPLRSSRLHLFGGTTGHWGGLCAPFESLDFKQRSWVPHSGWPITLEDLHPYYEKAHEYLELGPYNYDQAYWTEQYPDMQPLPLDPEVIWSKIWQFSPPTRFGSKYRNRIEKSNNIHLFTYANSTEIILGNSLNTVDHVVVKNHSGKRHTVRAKHFVLACGAIQNARLLLASNKQLPTGLGNQHNNAGRYFMEHLELKSAELWLSQPYSTTLYSYRSSDRRPRAEIAISEKVQQEYQMLNGTTSLTYLPVANEQEALIDLWENEDPRLAYDNFVKNFRASRDYYDKATEAGHYRAFELYTRMEQAPNPDSRISLQTEKDALGVPKASLHWDLTPLDRNSIRKLYEIIGKQVGMYDVGRVRFEDFLQKELSDEIPSKLGGGWHHMGTTRMSSEPEQGVVDADCRVHGLSNLYVAGSGCFTTAGAANPTLTLVALSLRLSDHLKSKFT